MAWSNGALRLRSLEITAPELVDVLVALLLSAYAVGLTSGTFHTGHAHGGIGASIGVLAMTLPVAWRRRAPLAAAGVICCGAVLNGVVFGHLVRCRPSAAGGVPHRLLGRFGTLTEPCCRCHGALYRERHRPELLRPSAGRLRPALHAAASGDLASVGEAFASISEATYEARTEIRRLIDLVDGEAAIGKPDLSMIPQLVSRARATGTPVRHEPWDAYLAVSRRVSETATEWFRRASRMP